MRKTLLFYMLLLCPLFVHGAQIPTEGLISPYQTYTDDNDFGFIEADPLYDEDYITFPNQRGNVVIAADALCPLCEAEANAASNDPESDTWVNTYNYCLANPAKIAACKAENGEACFHYYYVLGSIRANILLFLFLIIPYAMIRFYKYKKKEEVAM